MMSKQDPSGLPAAPSRGNPIRQAATAAPQRSHLCISTLTHAVESHSIRERCRRIVSTLTNVLLQTLVAFRPCRFTSAMAPMTAEELVQHPEYNHTIWDLKPEKKGKVAVANGRGGPIDIAYEVHGSGDRHLVVSLLYIWHS
jgi:hypothetical protein